MSRNSRWPQINASGSGIITQPHEDGSARDGKCECCERDAIGYVSVRWGPMRGSDIESYNACKRHWDMAHKQFDRYIAHLWTKDKFLKRVSAPQESKRLPSGVVADEP